MRYKQHHGPVPKTGIIDHYTKNSPRYGEIQAHTFTEAQMIVANAQSMFEELPSKARAAFNQDPARFLNFVNNLDPVTGHDDLVEVGLASPLLTTPDVADTPPDTQETPPSPTPDTEKPIDST